MVNSDTCPRPTTQLKNLPVYTLAARVCPVGVEARRRPGACHTCHSKLQQFK
jgi:hypothetical protein